MVSAAETMSLAARFMVKGEKTTVFPTETMAFVARTMIDATKTMVFVAVLVVSAAETMAIAAETMVSRVETPFFSSGTADQHLKIPAYFLPAGLSATPIPARQPNPMTATSSATTRSRKATSPTYVHTGDSATL